MSVELGEQVAEDLVALHPVRLRHPSVDGLPGVAIGDPGPLGLEGRAPTQDRGASAIAMMSQMTQLRPTRSTVGVDGVVDVDLVEEIAERALPLHPAFAVGQREAEHLGDVVARLIEERHARLEQHVGGVAVLHEVETVVGVG